MSRFEEDLKACILGELATLPGARIIKRKGQLFLRAGNGFEILCSRLFEMRSRWLELVEYADLTEENKWAIFCLMLVREDARIEEVPGLGLKVTLLPSPRH